MSSDSLYIDQDLQIDITGENINYANISGLEDKLIKQEKLSIIADQQTYSKNILEPYFSFLVKNNDKKEVFKSVGANPQLVKFLNQIHNKIIEFFPTNEIRIEKDLEYADFINIIIISKSNTNETLDNYHKFKKDFFLSVDKDIRQKISVGIEQL